MNSEEYEKFFHEVTAIFQQSNYNLSTPLLGEGGCFDLVARKKQVLLLVKLLENIDSLREEYAFELRKLALMLTGFPLIIGQRIRSDSDIEDGVVYSRYEIPVISLETLRALLLQHLPPLVYASRGGLKVKFDGERLRQKRLERNLSLKDFAKKVGVSKRAIYEYERGTIDVSLETALRIEEFLDTPLTMAINIFEEINKIGSLNHPKDYQYGPKSSLEREVKEHFDTIGLEKQFWTRRIPIRLLAKPLSYSEDKSKPSPNTTITGIAEKLENNEVVKKIQITYSLSRITHSSPLVIVSGEKPQTKIKGVPVLSAEELTKFKERKEKNEN